MTEQLAKAVATELKGVARHTGGNLWVVEWKTPLGEVVQFGADGVDLYESTEDCHAGRSVRGVHWT